MYYATLTENYDFTIEYPKNSESNLKLQLSADLENVYKLIEESKGKARWKLEGVAEALSYTLELLK